MKDFYLVLGVPANASLADIKKAYRVKAAEFHPDRNHADYAAQKFHEVKEAFDILGDEQARARYDENRRRNLLDDPLETAREVWRAYVTGVLQ